MTGLSACNWVDTRKLFILKNVKGTQAYRFLTTLNIFNQ
nr:MAG TPA: hypothetical protein [Caudoviricetes sp.]